MQDLWKDVTPYFGADGDASAVKHSALQLADVIDQLDTTEPDHTAEFSIAGIVAFAFRDYQRSNPDAPPNTDLGAVWTETMNIVDRTCREWGARFDLPEGGD